MSRSTTSARLCSGSTGPSCPAPTTIVRDLITSMIARRHVQVPRSASRPSVSRQTTSDVVRCDTEAGNATRVLEDDHQGAPVGSGHVLQMDGLIRTYGSVRALDGMSFTVRPGAVTGFLGPNGAGKTTTMRAIFRLTELDSGQVRWQGAPVDAAARRRFGYLPEERGLYPTMRVA